MVDLVNHPPHYSAHPSGVEVIELTEHLPFCLGNAVPARGPEECAFVVDRIGDRTL